MLPLFSFLPDVTVSRLEASPVWKVLFRSIYVTFARSENGKRKYGYLIFYSNKHFRQFMWQSSSILIYFCMNLLRYICGKFGSARKLWFTEAITIVLWEYLILLATYCLLPANFPSRYNNYLTLVLKEFSTRPWTRNGFPAGFHFIFLSL